MQLFLIFIGAVLVNNLVLARFLGICPFFGVSKKVETAIGMSLAVTFVMAVASIITWIVQYAVLEKIWSAIPSDYSFLSLLSHLWFSLWRWSLRRPPLTFISRLVSFFL